MNTKTQNNFTSAITAACTDMSMRKPTRFRPNNSDCHGS